MNAYLTLQDIRPGQNRYRSYIIKIETIDIGNNHSYVVKLIWGRIRGKKRILSYVCSNLDEIRSLLRPILKTRLRHGYRLVDKSENFPEYGILDKFQIGQLTDSNQLFLFQ